MLVDKCEVLLEDRLSELILLLIEVLLVFFCYELQEEGFFVSHLRLEQRLRGRVLREYGKASKSSNNANKGESDFSFH